MNFNILLENINILRKSLIFDTPKITNKIYISRKKALNRVFYKEFEIENIMQSLGYKIVYLEDMHLLDQIKIIRSSSHIVCAFGSALINTFLCESSTQVLSIRSIENFDCPVYSSVLDKLGIDYQEIHIYKNNINSLEYIKDEIKQWENGRLVV
jgi:capsular polysaccharide biosynthesis protein